MKRCSKCGNPCRGKDLSFVIEFKYFHGTITNMKETQVCRSCAKKIIKEGKAKKRSHM